jgi:hypothetical protein
MTHDSTVHSVSIGFFVAMDGKAEGDGTKAKPLDLVTALSDKAPAQPGDTLWLRGGTYRGEFTSTLTGKEDHPITVRQMPGGRATLDGSLTIKGEWGVYWGFEVMNSNPDRTTKDRPGGITVFGPYIKCNVFNVLDYFGKPVATGTYDGPPLRLPLKGTATGPEFNAFVVVLAN